VTAEAGSGADVPDAAVAAEAGGVTSSVSGDSDSGVPEVSGTVPTSEALLVSGFA
jgi:hypothetical protein